MTHTIKALAIAAGALAVSAALSAHDRVTTKVTWDREISRIVQARCVNCHVEGGRAPMPLRTYEQARPWAKAIRDEVLARRMPKWHAARGYGDFANDPSLSPFEIGLIAAWADGGAPRRTHPALAPGALPPPDGAAPPPPPSSATTTGAARGRRVTLPCGEQPLSGVLLGVHPQLSAGASATVVAVLPDDRREIVAWIRGYEPDFPTTYWLRNPLPMAPGSQLAVNPSVEGCQLTVTLR